MKRIMGVVLVGFLAVATVGCGTSGGTNNASSGSQGTSKKAIVMKIGITQTDNSPRMAGAKAIKSYVEQHSNGRIKVQIYPDSQLGHSKQEIQGMQSGSIQMVVFPTTSTTSFDPYFTMGDIPYLFPTKEKKLLALYKTKAFKEYMDTAQQYGIQPLAAWFEGYSTIASKTPVKSPSDFKKLKLRIIGSNIAKSYYTDLGTPPSSVAFSEVYTALQTGRINALDIPPNQIWENKFYEVANNITQTKHFALTSLVMVNKKWYDSLPSNLQKILSTAAQKATPDEVSYIDNERTKAISDMKSKGVNFYTPPTSIVNALKQETSKSEQRYVKANGSKGKKLLNDMKQAISNLQ